MVRPLPLRSGGENESEQRMTVGKSWPNMDGFALFHHKIVNEALEWRWISDCNLTLTLGGPALAAHSSWESSSALQLLAVWKLFK